MATTIHAPDDKIWRDRGRAARPHHGSLNEDASSATGRAIFKNMGEERIIDLVMTKVGDDWKVADVVHHHRPFSLKAEQ